MSAASVTIPHALGLGLVAFAPLAGDYSLGALALWSAALPGAVMTLLAARRGVIYAPSTIVALLYAAILSTVMSVAKPLGMGPAQVLAASGACVAAAFGIQWLFGALRLATLSRFLPLSVTYGFAAGVGLSMLISQLTSGFGMGHWVWSPQLLWHAAAALGVAILARAIQMRWRFMPGLLPAVVIVAAVILMTGASPHFVPAVVDTSTGFTWPYLPDWTAVPWFDILELRGTRLGSLVLLMALVNSLDILVFNQELELDHRLPGDPNAALRRESLIGALCGLMGFVPASTSGSRSRIALALAGPAPGVGPLHAAILLAVAISGQWWLQWVPMACLSGALLLAGLTQVPTALWSREYARRAPSVWTQSWLVATVFAVAGGAGALVAGLVVATFVLMHASANTAIRRALLDGQLRSRRLRRAAADAWLTSHMRQVAVIELQGVMSFGVSAHTAEQIRQLLQPRHDRVILDGARVAAWDATALVRVVALARDLADQKVQLAVCGFDSHSADAVRSTALVFSDLDRALEWAEEAMLEQRTPEQIVSYPQEDALGELGEGVSAPARAALEARLVFQAVPAQSLIFAAGESGTDILIVQSGLATLATTWPAAGGLRLATVGQGMAFGEMAFLNGQPRSACAGCASDGMTLARLSREAFDQWSREHPADALVIMANLAIIGTRRLAATTRQLRAVLE